MYFQVTMRMKHVKYLSVNHSPFCLFPVPHPNLKQLPRSNSLDTASWAGFMNVLFSVYKNIIRVCGFLFCCFN